MAVRRFYPNIDEAMWSGLKDHHLAVGPDIEYDTALVPREGDTVVVGQEPDRLRVRILADGGAILRARKPRSRVLSTREWPVVGVVISETVDYVTKDSDKAPQMRLIRRIKKQRAREAFEKE